MPEQQKSKLEKHGSEGSHRKAQDRLVNILMDNGWEVNPDCAFAVYTSLDSVYKTTFKETEWYHEWDIYATKRHDNGLVSELIIEIDGSSHNSKVQQGKDRTAEDYATFFLPDASFYRIEIGLLLDNKVSDEEIVSLYKIR